MKVKHGWSLLLFLLLAAVTYLTVFSRHDLGTVLFYIQKMDRTYLLLAGTASLFFVAAEGVMIWYLLRAVGGTAGAGRCIGYSFIGFFFSGITPSATGGQPMQLYYMKRDRQNLADSTVILMSVAVIYKMVLVLMGIGQLIWWRSGLAGYLGGYRWLYGAGLFLNLLLVVILLGIMLFPARLTGWLDRGERVLVKIGVLKASETRSQKITGFTERYKRAVVFFSKNLGKVAVVFFLTVLQRCSVFFLTYLIYRGFGLAGEGCLTVMNLRASIYIAVDMLPLPGAQGITELMYRTAFQTVFPGELLPAAMCVTRGLDFYFPLLAGLTVLIGYTIKSKWQNGGSAGNQDDIKEKPSGLDSDASVRLKVKGTVGQKKW